MATKSQLLLNALRAILAVAVLFGLSLTDAQLAGLAVAFEAVLAVAFQYRSAKSA